MAALNSYGYLFGNKGGGGGSVVHYQLNTLPLAGVLTLTSTPESSSMTVEGGGDGGGEAAFV
jgi:hypothetical protein